MAPKPSLLRHSDFMRLWVGQTISLFGSQFTLLAIPLIAILLLGAGPFEMGLLATLETAPFLLLGLFVGVWVDRYPRRPILIVGDLGRAALLLVVPGAALLGFLSMPILYAVSFLVGILTVFFEIAYQAYLPSLVERDQILEGNSKLEATRAVAQMSGPGIAGIALQVLFKPLVIVIDALSFVISGAFLLRIGRPEVAPQRQGRTSMWVEVREGLRVVLGDPRLRLIAGCTSTSNFFGTAVQAIFLLYVVANLGLTPAGIGLIFALGSIGALVGALAAGGLARRLGLGHAIIGSMLVGSAGALLVLVVTPATAFPLLVVAFFLMSFSAPAYNINQVSLRQAITPGRLQGRMNATMRFLVWGTMPLGGLTGGALGAVLGLYPAVVVTVVGGSLAVLWVLPSPIRRLREIPRMEAPEAPGLPTVAPAVLALDGPKVDDVAGGES